jgi:hypothetical protein
LTFGWEPPLVPFVSPSIGWLVALDAPRRLSSVVRADVVQPTAPLVPFVSPSVGWLLSDSPRPIAPLSARPIPVDPPTPLAYLSASTGWLNVNDPPRQPVALRRVEPVAPIGIQFAIFLPGLFWLTTPDPRTPYRSQPSVPVDPVGSLLVTPPLPNQSWLYATPDPRTPYRTQRAVVVDPIGSAFPFLPAFGPHWYTEARRPAASPPPNAYPSAPLSALQPTVSSLGWMVEGGRVVVRPSAPAPRPTDAHLSALQFGGAPWGDVPLARAVLQNRPALASVAPLVSLGPPSFGWHAVESFTRRVAGVVVPLPVEVPTALSVTSLNGLGWMVADSTGRRIAPVIRPTVSDPLPALATPFSPLPWVTVEPVRAVGRTRGVVVVEPVGALLPVFGRFPLVADTTRRPAPIRTVEPSQPVGDFYPPPVLPSIAWLVAATPLPRAFQPRVVRPEQAVVYGSVRVVVLPPLVPDGEQFTWHVPEESLVSIVQFDYRRRR